MKKIIAIALALVLVFSFCACSNKTESSDTGSNVTKESDISIDDIAWTVEEGIEDGERVLFFSVTNNSKYSIKEIEMSFKQKADVTEEQLDAFFSKVQTISEFSDEEMEELKAEANYEASMNASNEYVIGPGETDGTGRMCYFTGYYYCDDLASYELVEPDIATITYIDGETLKTVYYDFVSKKYTKDSSTEVAYEWSEKELANSIPKPNAPIVSVSIDYDESFSFYAYGVTEDYAKSYANEFKEAGFTEDAYSSDFLVYRASTTDGKKVTITYDESGHSLDVMVTVSSSDTE